MRRQFRSWLARHEVAIAVSVWVLMVLVTGLQHGVIHVDHVRGTYGVSIGSDTRYCSAELNTNPHGGGIGFWCENAV